MNATTTFENRQQYHYFGTTKTFTNGFSQPTVVHTGVNAFPIFLLE